MNSQAQVSEESEQMKAEQAYRAGAYGLFARLFRSAPDQDMLNDLMNLNKNEKNQSGLEKSMSDLGLAAKHFEVDAINDEFHALFIGLGRGEMLPYGSWYQTGFLMEKPLGILRDDLTNLGYEKSEETVEPEDHIAALCEVMSLLISEGINEATTNNCVEQQRHFFEAHIGTWVAKFFNDLKEASSADFYRSVADLGRDFFEFETQYFSMKV